MMIKVEADGFTSIYNLEDTYERLFLAEDIDTLMKDRSGKVVIIVSEFNGS